MSTTLIGPQFDNTGKIIKNKTVNDEKETAESKVDNVEEARASITSTKNNNEKVDASINSIKIRMTQSTK